MAASSVQCVRPVFRRGPSVTLWQRRLCPIGYTGPLERFISHNSLGSGVGGTLFTALHGSEGESRSWHHWPFFPQNASARPLSGREHVGVKAFALGTNRCIIAPFHVCVKVAQESLTKPQPMNNKDVVGRE